MPLSSGVATTSPRPPSSHHRLLVAGTTPRARAAGGSGRTGWPPLRGHPHTAELADLFASPRELTDSKRADRAADFLRVRGETGLLRRWEEGRIVGAPLDRYDPLLLELTTCWTVAARVVGTAMGRCDGHNLMSDLFFSSRLQRLIDAGRIVADGRRDRLREYAVRLARA